MKDMQKASGLRIFVGAVIIMVVAVIVVGLYVAGAPDRVRDLRLDETRTNDLQQVAAAIDNAYDRDAALPESLDWLKSRCTQDCYVSGIVDPKTRVPYEYRVTGQTTYELCATFDDVTQPLNQYGQPQPATTPVMPYGKPYPAGYRDWTHGAGRHCYTIDAQDRMATAACGLRNPCQSGQTCAQLPNKKGTFCVPAGKECLAAGCPQDKCVVSESYPVQIRCAGEPAAPAETPATK